MAAATGLTSTVEDMAKFVSAQFRKGQRGGDRILSTASLREMHRVRMLENNWTRGNAIGFAVNRADGKNYIGHGGGYPGYTTNTIFELESRVGVIVLTNTNDSNPADIARQLMSSVGNAVADATKETPDKINWDPAWGRFAGLYRSRWDDLHVVMLNESLVIISPNGRSLANQIKLVPLGEDVFRLEANAGGLEVGEVVRFVEEDGQAVRLITGDTFFDRVSN